MKNCSRAVGEGSKAVFLGFGFVSAQFGFPSPANQAPRIDVRFAQRSQECAQNALRRGF